MYVVKNAVMIYGKIIAAFLCNHIGEISIGILYEETVEI